MFWPDQRVILRMQQEVRRRIIVHIEVGRMQRQLLGTQFFTKQALACG